VNERHVVGVYQGKEVQRLDKYITGWLADYSRSQIQKLIKEGCVRVNERAVLKTGAMLEQGDRIRIVLPEVKSAAIIPEEIPLDIIFENQDVIVVNKPAGMVVHPSAGHSEGTLVHAVLAHAPEMRGIGGEKRPGVVHRLDKNTSGLILMAKNDAAHRWLQKQFKDRKVEKWYIALTDGHPPTPKGRVDAPIGRDRSHRQRMSVVPLRHGRNAVTEYFTEKRFDAHSLLNVHLLTGRTHQIRVHLAFIGCPVAGDTVYGQRTPTIAIDRQFLHAARMSIVLPGETQARHFEAPLPKELQEILNTL